MLIRTLLPIWRRASAEFRRDGLIDSAGSLTFFAMLSLFPALLVIFSLLGLLGQRRTTQHALLSLAHHLAPSADTGAVRQTVEHFIRFPASSFLIGGGVLVAVWTSSGYVTAFGRAMNRVYNVAHQDGYLKRKPYALAVTLILLVLGLVITFVLTVTGPTAHDVGEAVGIGPLGQDIWSVIRWPILAAAAVFAIAVLFHSTPDARQPSFRWLSVGAAIALFLIVLASIAFDLYLNFLSHYTQTYGVLAGVIVLMIWLWLVNMSILIGAEFDAEFSRLRAKLHEFRERGDHSIATLGDVVAHDYNRTHGQ